MNSPNFLRYMQYAIGEIILIIIGVMIILYLDNIRLLRERQITFIR